MTELGERFGALQEMGGKWIQRGPPVTRHDTTATTRKFPCDPDPKSMRPATK